MRTIAQRFSSNALHTEREELKKLDDAAGHKPVLRFPARLLISAANGGKERLNSVKEAEDFLKASQPNTL